MAGSRFFLSGLILMGAFGLGHLGGFLRGAYLARHDPNLADLTRAMRAHKVKLLRFEPSLLDFREYLSVNFSILLLLASAVGFAAFGLGYDHAATIRMLSPVYIAGMLLLLGTSAYFSVVQGIITCPAIAILFGVAWWLS